MLLLLLLQGQSVSGRCTHIRRHEITDQRWSINTICTVDDANSQSLPLTHASS